MAHVGPLGKKLNFFVSLGIAEILEFSELSVDTEVVPLKTFPQHFELCLHGKLNIEDIVKFYNLCDKTSKIGFRMV